MLHLKIGQQPLALPGFQVRDPETSGQEVPRSAAAHQVIQFLGIRREGWKKRVAF